MIKSNPSNGLIRLDGFPKTRERKRERKRKNGETARADMPYLQGGVADQVSITKAVQ